MSNANDINRQAEEAQIKKNYQKMVEEITPKANLWQRCLWAFIVGGIICVIGQAIMYAFENWLGMTPEDAASWNTIILIFVSVLLTNFGIYRNLVSFAGAGALVPITGFANSVASAATEFKSEGWVFGVGCKIFTIAGPVILYGLVASWLLGMVYWIISLF
ncbi:MAG: stage V sporulation protein AC [Lachnospiraceae bacterium]|nr:stage V sporulation protein AC [Lachnospiraceae bacterium]